MPASQAENPTFQLPHWFEARVLVYSQALRHSILRCVFLNGGSLSFLCLFYNLLVATIGESTVHCIKGTGRLVFGVWGAPLRTIFSRMTTTTTRDSSNSNTLSVV